jgi:hypothetical protein
LSFCIRPDFFIAEGARSGVTMRTLGAGGLERYGSSPLLRSAGLDSEWR